MRLLAGLLGAALGSASPEGAHALSSDGRYMTLAGYGAVPGTASVAHTPASSTPVTVAASQACSTDPVSIGSVQGTGDVSPRAGQVVTVRGTVVADDEGPSPALRGFSLQDAGDGDVVTSDGIFVFNGNSDLVTNGTVVQVTGTASEFQGQTQITSTTGGVQSCGPQSTVIPTDITLPRAIATDLEPFEGMLVRLRQTATVTETFQLGRFGQVVVSSGGKLRQPTAVLPASDTAAVQALQAANDLNRLILDDASQAQHPDPIAFGCGGQPLSASNTLRGGDTVTDASACSATPGPATRPAPTPTGCARSVRWAGPLCSTRPTPGRMHRPRWHRRDHGGQRQPAQLLHHLHRLHLRVGRRTGRLPRRGERR